MIVLDTDVLIEILNKRSRRGEDAVEVLKSSDEDVVTTSIAIHEVQYGLEKRGKMNPDILRLRALPYTKGDAHLSAKLELLAEGDGTPIHRMDAMIASIAINNGARLFTYNLSHYKPLQQHGLQLLEVR